MRNLFVIVFILRSFYVITAQNSNDLPGRWASFDVFSDSCLNKVEIVSEILDWDYEFKSNGSYLENNSGYCDNHKFTISGTWTYLSESNDLNIYPTVICSDINFDSYSHNSITWVSREFFYSCYYQDDRTIMTYFIRLKNP